MIRFFIIILVCTLNLYVYAGDGIKIYSKNPSYWQYNGKPILLLGATDDDNVYNWPIEKMQRHLEKLVQSGGNYDRCTMSCRDEGNLSPFLLLDNGKYDLDRWNDEFWQRFSAYLQQCKKLDIVVQIEIWAKYDFYRENHWSEMAFNPQNNINYDDSPKTSLLSTGNKSGLGFFETVPELNNDKIVLKYQKAFVDKILSYSFKYDNVLYTMDNEFGWNQDYRWSKYWAEYILETAKKNKKEVFITEMNQTDWPVINYVNFGKIPGSEEKLSSVKSMVEKWKSPWVFNNNHLQVYDNPQLFSFVDFSDNANAYEQQHWDALSVVRNYVNSVEQRPINHNKMYGADFGPRWPSYEAIDMFWRNIFGGAASVRFHRPPTGLGQQEIALTNITIARGVETTIDITQCRPLMDRISYREENEVYCIGIPDKTYLIYFTAKSGDGWVRLDIGNSDYYLEWIDLTNGNRTDKIQIKGLPRGIVIKCPSRSHEYGWLGIITAKKTN